MKLAKPDATEKEIMTALELGSCMSFINKYQDGIDTSVGAGGGKLSGGQKQRVAIARAFLKRPRVLILDEATSALDNANEQKIQDAVEAYRKEIGSVTVLVIAHRLSTIRNADKIVVLKNGVVKGQGNHDELLANTPDGGIYAHLVELEEGAHGKDGLKQKAHEGEHLVDTSHKDEDHLEDHELELKKKRTRKRSIGGKLTTVEMTALEETKLMEADDIDDEYDKKVQEEIANLPG